MREALALAGALQNDFRMHHAESKVGAAAAADCAGWRRDEVQRASADDASVCISTGHHHDMLLYLALQNPAGVQPERVKAELSAKERAKQARLYSGHAASMAHAVAAAAGTGVLPHKPWNAGAGAPKPAAGAAAAAAVGLSESATAAPASGLAATAEDAVATASGRTSPGPGAAAPTDRTSPGPGRAFDVTACIAKR